jgi:hypothetical protein
LTITARAVARSPKPGAANTVSATSKVTYFIGPYQFTDWRRVAIELLGSIDAKPEEGEARVSGDSADA